MLEENGNTPVEGQVAPQATETKAWYDGMSFQPEDVGYIQNKKWEKPESVVNAYRELEKFRGVSEDRLVTIPKDNMDSEGWTKVFNKLGRPDTPESYGEFKLPEGIDTQLDPNRIKWADQIVHKLGLNKDQRNMLLSETVKYEDKTVKDAMTGKSLAQEAELNKLKNDWGVGYSERESLGKRAVNSFLTGSSEDKATLLSKMEDAIGTAQLLRLFSNIGEKIGEDRMPTDKTEGRSFGYTREQAMADKQTLMSELAADKIRLSNYNKGIGPDYDKMKKYMTIITS